MDNFDLLKYLKNNVLLTEIKVNNPNWVNFEAEVDDDDGNWKILELSHKEGTWYGYYPYNENPNMVIFEFTEHDEYSDDKDEINDFKAETKSKNNLIKLLTKFSIPYKKVDNNIEISKDLVNIK